MFVFVNNRASIYNGRERSAIFPLHQVFHATYIITPHDFPNIFFSYVPVFRGYHLEDGQNPFKVIPSIAETVKSGTVGKREIASFIRFKNGLWQ